MRQVAAQRSAGLTCLHLLSAQPIACREALQAPGPAQKALASKLALFRELEARSTEVVCTALDTLLRCDGATLE